LASASRASLASAQPLASCEARVTLGPQATPGGVIFEAKASSSNFSRAQLDGGAFECVFVSNGVTHQLTHSVGLPINSTSRVSCSAEGSPIASVRACVDGACQVGLVLDGGAAQALFSGATELWLGATPAASGFELGPGAGVSDVQCHRSPGRFR
jgi:hypothetical protein